MKVLIEAKGAGMANTCHDVLRALLGQVQFLPFGEPTDTADLRLFISTRPTAAALPFSSALLTVQVEARLGPQVVIESASEYLLVKGEEPNQLKRLVKLAVYRATRRIMNLEPLPWGILTGIRPTKIVHRLMDLGWDNGYIERHLTESYDMEQSKAAALVEVALANRPFLLSSQEASSKVSIYIGIPFCPTRCAYCSFPAYPKSRSSNLLKAFSETLKKEISAVGKALKALGFEVQTVYIGGGTPTVLEGEQLAELFEWLHASVDFGKVQEFTLEAGRPDTLNGDKLRLSQKAGVTRLSINPQTMDAETLKLIGRNHSPEEVVRAFHLARETGFNNINMDLIIGLPGETCQNVENTLQEIYKLRPENLTVHTLAVKRASALRERLGDYVLPGERVITDMLALTDRYARSLGMQPYYLYRQKYMVGPMENLGYAAKGFEGLYNIQVIEERQTILGLGAGAATKFVNPADWTLTSFYNPKDPETYIKRVDDFINLKVDKLSQRL